MAIRGGPVNVEGKVKLALTMGQASLNRTHYAVFLVVKLPLQYNAILERMVLHNFEAVMSIQYLTMKFSLGEGIGVVKGRQDESQAILLRKGEFLGNLILSIGVEEALKEKRERLVRFNNAE